VSRLGNVRTEAAAGNSRFCNPPFLRLLCQRRTLRASCRVYAKQRNRTMRKARTLPSRHTGSPSDGLLCGHVGRPRGCRTRGGGQLRADGTPFAFVLSRRQRNRPSAAPRRRASVRTGRRRGAFTGAGNMSVSFAVVASGSHRMDAGFGGHHIEQTGPRGSAGRQVSGDRIIGGLGDAR